MSATAIIIAAAVIGVTGLVVGLGLGLFGEKFKVEVDPREAAIREALPGNNCGGCGYAGCDACAKAINEGKAEVNACPVGRKAVADEIAKIMGVENNSSVRMVAFVKCSGTCDAAPKRYNYSGVVDCGTLSVVPGGNDKACRFGCLGYGNCVKACEFDAIHIVNGIAVVDEEKCTGCKKCMKACPQKLIELVPEGHRQRIRCNSQAKGKDVLSVCSTGCIGCSMCVKQCTETMAIHMDGNLPVIDYSKCVGCGKCAEKCPKKVIN